MRNVSFRLIFVLALSLVLPALAAIKIDAQLSKTLSQETDSIKYEFNLDGDNKTARLRVKARLEGGFLSWRLKDPNGNTRLEGEVTSGKVGSDSGELKSIAGVWILEMDCRNATGNYKIDWTSR